mgnify:CR=1
MLPFFVRSQYRFPNNTKLDFNWLEFVRTQKTTAIGKEVTNYFRNGKPIRPFRIIAMNLFQTTACPIVDYMIPL